MNQYDFDLLLKKYVAGECTPEEKQQIQDWSENTLAETRIIIAPSEKNIIRKRIWKRLSGANRKVSIFGMPWVKLGMAASVLITLAYGALMLQKTSVLKKTTELTLGAQTILPKGNIELKNTSDKSHKVVLEDGTEVTLQAQSSLSYPEHFDSKARIVHLSGEAFFNVTKNPARPFFVYTGQLVTRVLGTSFNIKSLNSAKSIEVSVVTGRVSVYENSKKTARTRNGIILNPNQKIRFDIDKKVLVPELVEEPIAVHPPEKKASFIFEETPLPEVIAILQQVYGVEIVLENSAIERCVFTGDINDLPLYSQLRLICKSISGNYELRGTTLFISGDGCRN
ncbi:FecR family protein [Dyadobacter subterraneus]|uniref:FecR family protein n=1 Tax=Dyadobacter subterraneus TaxID=2773304 RepID=A0ABR9WGS5_9BACT|nr:FecR family protein [Dyadobacter subterraneus]MBE9463551.1 FecR family protein [Dyadobacter subterraneus]